MQKIGIINYGMGNIASVRNAFNFIGESIEVIDSPGDIDKYEKLILPGVGAFAMAMENLNSKGFIDPLNKAVLTDQKKIIGLCLGMQLLFESSEEHGLHNGLGWIKGQVKDLRKEVDLVVPHMGWNRLEKRKDSELLNGISIDDMDVYFVHSYYCHCTEANDIVATVNYGVSMDVMVQRDNIYGCQFHPEKSQKSGLEILKNFCRL